MGICCENVSNDAPKSPGEIRSKKGKSMSAKEACKMLSDMETINVEKVMN